MLLTLSFWILIYLNWTLNLTSILFITRVSFYVTFCLFFFFVCVKKNVIFILIKMAVESRARIRINVAFILVDNAENENTSPKKARRTQISHLHFQYLNSKKFHSSFCWFSFASEQFTFLFMRLLSISAFSSIKRFQQKKIQFFFYQEKVYHVFLLSGLTCWQLLLISLFISSNSAWIRGLFKNNKMRGCVFVESGSYCHSREYCSYLFIH